MTVLYVTQPGAQVRKKGMRIHVEWNAQVQTSLPLQVLERVVLLGPVQFSAGAGQALLRLGIPVLLCSTRGRCYGVLTNGAQDTNLLLGHVARYQDGQYRLNIAKAIVSAKVTHQERLLRRHVRNYDKATLAEVAQKIATLRGTLLRRTSVPEVMGVEGQASALYFSALGECLRQAGITFTARNRRPPRDPVNAVLSLGYMLVLAEVLTAVMTQGLAPGLGFLHEVSPRRPALALDLLELGRQPIVDRLTLSLFNRGVLKVDDFQTGPVGDVRLRDAGLKRFLRFYERAMSTEFQFEKDGGHGTFRTWLRLHAFTLKDAITRSAPWVPTPLML